MRISESGFRFKDERLNGCYLVVKSYTYIILQKGLDRLLPALCPCKIIKRAISLCSASLNSSRRDSVKTMDLDISIPPFSSNLVIECLINFRQNNYEVVRSTLLREVTLISSVYDLAN